MIHLKETPILLEFLEKLFKFENIKFNFKFEDTLFLHSYCKCGDLDCATLYLKKEKPWKEEFIGHHIINTNKGMIIIHFIKEGYMQLEALGYENYPYKEEVANILKDRVSDIEIPIKKRNYKEITTLGKKAIDLYFNDLEYEKMETIYVDI